MPRLRAPVSLSFLFLVFTAAPSSAQEESHAHADSGWTLAWDGRAFLTLDLQGARRGSTTGNSQNWLMATATREAGGGALALTGMISLEPLTVGAAGYPELLQEGEAYHGLQVTDRQHPHDLLMQLAAAWRYPLGERAAVSIGGGPAGEASLGPVAFMHRPSASENPSAPLSHHIFDSTHVVHGVATVGADAGSFSIEGSVFRGREPDEHRYDLELGALDSWSIRAWWRPNGRWLAQVSHGYLHEPEQLEPGDQRRTNASVSWLRVASESHFVAATAAVGQTVRQFSTVRALLVELTARARRTSVYGRFEDLGVETEILLFPQIVHRPHPGELVDPVRELTAGVVRDVADIRGVRVGVGADVVFYGLPPLLQFTHGDTVRSGHVFVRIEPSHVRPMWNMTMGRMAGHAMD